MGNKQLNKKKKSRKRQLIRFQKTMELTKRRKLDILTAKLNTESSDYIDHKRKAEKRQQREMSDTGWSDRNIENDETVIISSEPSHGKKRNGPKSLASLCERVIKKYKLIAPSEPKKFTPPETFSVVGGKALRKRSEGPFPRKSRNKTTYSPRSLAVLCQLVIEEYNLLPQTEESLLPTSGRLPVSKNDKRSRGRPRKAVQKDDPKIKRSRGRPRKDSNLGNIQQPALLEEEPISYPDVRVKEESSTPYLDPLQDEENEDDYTIEIKFEAHDNEIDEFTHVDPVVTSPQSIAIPQSTVTYPQSHMQVPGPSITILPRTPQFITVVMDEYQIFANRIAEQLRGFPPQRALLLQRGIQAMIDNEKELIEDEH